MSEKAKQKTTISFPPEVLRKLRKLAALREISMSDLVEEIVARRLDEEQERLDQIEQIMKSQK